MLNLHSFGYFKILVVASLAVTAIGCAAPTAEDEDEAGVQIPTKITPLPGLTESLKRFELTLNEMEQDMLRRQKVLADLEREQEEKRLDRVEATVDEITLKETIAARSDGGDLTRRHRLRV